MSTSSQGVAGPSGRPGLQPVFGQPVIPPEQLISNQLRRLTQSVETLRAQHEESTVTKEQIYALSERLEKLDVGVNSGDAVHRLQSAQRDALLVSLGRITDKLQGVSTLVEDPGYVGSDNREVVSKLMDEVRAAIADCESIVLASTIPGELPPPAPRACFGRDDLIEEIAGFAENLTPTALIGAGGIGKTSIALAVLHHHRVKQRFKGNRRFIRCDQFPATVAHLLNRLSDVTGAGVENPKDLTSLYPFLSSREMIIILDNAESVLDPQGVDAAKIYALVEELCRSETICLCITSRIFTIPSECEIFEIPTLSMNSAQDVFYRIYKKREQSNLINDILEQLDFHPLSITLLATVAYQNRWSMDRVVREWETRRTSVLRTRHDNSLAATVELSLASPMFQELGPDARELLGVIAFFPQGINEENLNWLLPTISNGTDILDGFCTLSLTYRSNGFVTMLAPLRDYLRPKDPKSATLLRATKENYFSELSVDIVADEPSFRESQWIVSEDINVEHLLDVFTTIDANSEENWDACTGFMHHLRWHKGRLTILQPKIEGLPDDHRSKPKGLTELSQLFYSVGNYMECKRLLTHALKLQRCSCRVPWILEILSEANRRLGLFEEGIQQAEEALEISEERGDTADQSRRLISLAYLLNGDNQLDAAADAVFRALDLLTEEGNQYRVYQSHHLLGDVYRAKGETEKAVYHLELALGIATSFNWHGSLFWVHHSLAELSLGQGRFDDAHAHTNKAESHAVNGAYEFGRAIHLRAVIWCRQDRFEEARPEALRAMAIFEKIGATKAIEDCEELLWDIQEQLDSPVTSDQSDSDSLEAE